MVIYEVNLEVKEAIFNEYFAWLKPHIKELLTLEGFIKADLLFDNEQASEGVRKIVVTYYLKDYAAYHHYINTHALKMREDAIKRFAGQSSAHRRVLELEGSYSL
ncbi:DUF4286 family protein [Legionella cardiaca]|uniref:DUF4286 family protein n=1 Tax=Legionella cardiaca TaxID=1071983 RepID=A0ABY8AT27_9GAMM|nr:DUF4286 family protein [Legionella cardiaca]WED43663.1 DUF4286 family protein [Legionella cardiaca]